MRRPTPQDSNSNQKQDLGQAPKDGAAPGAAVVQENSPSDPDLAKVIEAWSELPEPVKAGIVAMVKAATIV